MTGTMWFSMADYSGLQSLRHDCDMAHGIQYNWLQHDGRTFGSQLVVENARQLQLQTDWLKRGPFGEHGGEWTTRVTADSPEPYSLILYYGGGGDSELTVTKPSAKTVVIQGQSRTLGPFTIHLFIGTPQPPIHPIN